MTHDNNTPVELDDPEQRWGKLYSEWLGIRAEWAASGYSIPDERADELGEREKEITLAMAATPAPARYIAQKLQVLEDALYADRDALWADRRDRLLLTSISTDVRALS